MSTLHLKSGDACPEGKEGRLRVYCMRFCPWSHRTRLALAFKDIPHDVVLINLTDKPEWFTSKNPVGTVPTIELPDGKVLWESTIVNDYLDEAYPDKKLNPDDPFEKARQRIIVERWGKVYLALRKIAGDAEKFTELNAEFHELLKVFDNFLTDTYFGGESPRLCDFSMWPIMERIHAMSKMGFRNIMDDSFAENFPKLQKWFDAMMNQSAVKENYTSPEIAMKYFESVAKGSPHYDF